MSIILLSDTYKNQNQSLLGDIKYILRGINSVAYIPSAYDRYHDGYNTYVEPFFEKMGLTNVQYCGLEDPDYDQDTDKKLQDSPIIFLSGGNTFHFLYWLRKRNLISRLKDFSNEKIIIGVSAGAILLTPNIGLSGDKNLIIPSNDTLDSVDAVKFFIKPHFVDSLYNAQLIKAFRNNLPKEKQFPIFGIPDDGGIIIEDNRINKYGKVKTFYAYVPKAERIYST